MRNLILAAASVALASCGGNILTGDFSGPGGSPIVIPTGGCTIHFDGSWDCNIGGAGGPVPEAVAPVTVAPPPVVEPAPAEEAVPMTPEALNALEPGMPPS